MYGKTIKEIRIKKYLSLKMVYSGICSKTNAIKFEKGLRQISIDKFLKVLDNLTINFEELLWIHNGCMPSPTSKLSYELTTLWNEGKVSEFKKYINFIRKNSTGMDKVKLANYVLLKEHSDGKNLENNNSNEFYINIITNYLSNLQYWTIYDFKTFNNSCYLIPYKLMIYLLKEALRAQKRYLFFNNMNQILYSILSNCIDRMILEKDFNNANNFTKRLDEISLSINNLEFRLLNEYYKAKIEYLTTNKINGKKRLINILNTANILKVSQIKNEIKSLLKIKG
ncbi:Rgg family transcriptional regulator [Apilactobacillus xinyiensis]|uniref:Rgg family transcriptional regulator n=1 Tax=Apilactobacillus xinyiensis TaxID=2841032 RepID=UPI001C7DE09B|nr:Rgg/GadR/MutR family transcriptional regulator [Apilactobacillus xinyiensis]